MRNFSLKCFALLLTFFALFLTACKASRSNSTSEEGLQDSEQYIESDDSSNKESQSVHTHNFNKQVKEERYLKDAATCKHGAQYYYTCDCGEIGEEYFENGETISCDYSAEIEDEKYLRRKATCQRGAEYYKSCTMCGSAAYRETFISPEFGDHSYTDENPDFDSLKEDATFESPAIYYKSCICGALSEETFTYGEPLRSYTEQEKKAFAPTSLTLTLYDPQKSIYGITYNTQSQPLRPIIQVSTNADLSNAIEFHAHFEKHSNIPEKGVLSADYYIVKAEIDLEPNTTYYYRAYDKHVDVGSQVTMLVTKDTTAENFTFAHLADTQSSTNVGTAFGTVLSHVTTSDFIVHTGDVVEWSLYENEWTNMLHTNYAYLSTIPMMAISGNHETTYQNGNNETYKHFNHKIPTQTSTTHGYYYSFIYGNVKFIMLNTNRLTGNQLTSDQYNWLIGELTNNVSTWTVVAMHNPMYSAGVYGSNPDRNQISVALRAQLHNVFVEYGVDIVLQGHDHLISKTKPLGIDGEVIAQTTQTVNGIEYAVSNGGVIYVMSGTAGEQYRSPYATYDSSLYDIADSSKKCSWAEFTVNGNTISVNVKYASGSNVQTLYTWNLLKTDDEAD